MARKDIAKKKDPRANATLQELPLDLIDDHPDNPRLVFRQDVIDGIASSLDGEYPKKHAVHVRPVGDRYQLTSGHQRKRAAEKKQLAKVWAWVEHLDDDTAFMELRKSNAQGELSPLEDGKHAFGATKGNKWSGATLTQYASDIGKSGAYVSQVRAAYEVLETVNFTQVKLMLGKYKHLYAIHKEKDQDFWPVLVGYMLEKEWSAADTKYWVDRCQEFNEAIPRPYAIVGYLDRHEVLKRFLETKEFSARTVIKLVDRADAIKAMIKATDVEAEKHTAEFQQWLIDNAGGKSWDLRKLELYERELRARLEEEGAQRTEAWVLGDWRDRVGKLEDGSVALVLTDPPYGADYQSDYRLDRRKDRKHGKLANDAQNEGPGEAREALAALHPKLTEDAHVFCFCHWSNEAAIREAVTNAGYKVRGSLVWVKNNTGMGDPRTTFAPKHERIIHAVKGSPTLFDREADVLEFDRVDTKRHPTEKPLLLLRRLIEVSTVAGELVADPFGGVASTLVAAKNLGRNYWGCELDEAYHKDGAKRLKEE